MNMLNQEEAKRICDKILALSKADECRITINGARTGNIRFALNNISTSGLVDDCQLSVAVAFGKRQGTATINELDDKSLERVVRRAEELARLAPENPQFEAAVDKQNFLASPTFIQRTADIDPEFRAEIAARSIEACRKKKMIAAGYFTDNASFEVIANSNGVFGYQTFTTSEYSCTTRTEDERGSGWVSRGVNDVRKFDVREAVGVAIEKGLRSVDAKALEPGRYTVILEPAASAGLMGPMFNAFDQSRSDLVMP